MTRNRLLLTLAVAASLLALPGCYGSSAGYVGVYGAPYYGPGAWGAYPYPGRYPPMGGGVWVGVPICCDEDGQDSDPGTDGSVPEQPPSVAEEPPVESSNSGKTKTTSVPLLENGPA